MAPGQIAGKQASAQKRCATLLPRNNKGKSGSQSKSTDCISVSPLFPVSNTTIDILAYDSTTTYDDKVARMLTLRARWEYEDNEDEALDGDALQTRQGIRCREFGWLYSGSSFMKPRLRQSRPCYIKKRLVTACQDRLW